MWNSADLENGFYLVRFSTEEILICCTLGPPPLDGLFLICFNDTKKCEYTILPPVAVIANGLAGVTILPAVIANGLAGVTMPISALLCR